MARISARPDFKEAVGTFIRTSQPHNQITLAEFFRAAAETFIAKYKGNISGARDSVFAAKNQFRDEGEPPAPRKRDRSKKPGVVRVSIKKGRPEVNADTKQDAQITLLLTPAFKKDIDDFIAEAKTGTKKTISRAALFRAAATEYIESRGYEMKKLSNRS
jgi:hypothetical protein